MHVPDHAFCQKILRNKIVGEELQAILTEIMEQADARYREWGVGREVLVIYGLFFCKSNNLK